MKLLTFSLRALALAGVLAALPLRAAIAAWESTEFHAVVTGTSTLHDWSVESRTATGGFTLEPAAGRLETPAKSLSGEAKGLNERMFAALKADAHPTITFVATELKFPADPAGTAEIPVRGRLTIAGTPREITLPCRASAPDASQFVLETEVALKLTDFGIKPPTFMGMIRTGDAIKVKIRWTLRPARVPGPAPSPLAHR